MVDKAEQEFFSEDFLKLLEELSFHSRKIFFGGLKGDRLSRLYGSSVEFVDYRRYQPGDDLRYIDWNLYARLDRLFLRLFRDEANLRIYLLVDKSASMNWGRPNKLLYAVKVAAALSFVGIANQEWVGVSLFSSQLDEVAPLGKGRAQIYTLIDFLRRTRPGKGTDMANALRMFAAQNRYPGIAIVISDFWDPEGWQAGFNCLLERGFEVSAIQVISREEENPRLWGHCYIRDMEMRRRPLRLTVDAAVLRRIRQAVGEYCQRLGQFCADNQIIYLRTYTDQPFEELVLRYMKLRSR